MYWKALLGPLCLLIIKFCYEAIAAQISKRLRASLTALDDLPLLGTSRKDGQKIWGTAVICGGSVAGLLAARVCSDHFDEVVIVEPEGWVATREGLRDKHRQGFSDPSIKKRTRVAQYPALHAYQAFMALALRKLFKHFDREIESEGGRILPADTAVHIDGELLPAPYKQFPNGALPETMLISRPVFETTLRRLVLSRCPNVKYTTASVSALLPHVSKNYVSSVKLRLRDGEETTISATLVVDCTGPATGGWRWLQDSAFESKTGLALRDAKITYDPKVLYTTCEYDILPHIAERFRQIGLPSGYDTAPYFYTYIPHPEVDNRLLVITRREKRYLQIACGGWNDTTRITSVSDIQAFLGKVNPTHRLPGWMFAMLDILEEENISGTYVRDRTPAPFHVQYYRVANIPSNFVALGDAVLQLNPVRGLGCTKACVDAVTLNAHLAKRIPELSGESKHFPIPKDFSRVFFAAQMKRTGSAWNNSRLYDYAWKSTVPVPGDNLTSTGVWRRWYSSQIIQLALEDPEVASVLWRVSHWLTPQTDLVAPWISWRFVLKWLKERIRG